MAYRERNINDFQEAKRAREAKKSRFSPVGDIEPRDVEALWDGRLPVGASTLLTGRGGLGKSTLCAWVAAEASRGAFGRPLATVFLSAEDPVDSVLQARLRAAGADIGLVWAPRFGADRPNITASLLDEIGELRLPAPLGLLVFDGFVDFIIGINTYDDHQIRPIFARLEAWAQPRGVAVVGIVHPPKTNGAGIAGTRAFRDCSRSVLVAESHPLPDHPYRVLLHHEKHNWTPQAPMLVYEPGAGTVRWLPLIDEDEPSEDVAAAIRADLEGFKDAGEFLREALADGPRAYADLVQEAGRLGIPARTLRYARKKLGVESSAKGFGGRKEAMWWLP